MRAEVGPGPVVVFDAPRFLVSRDAGRQIAAFLSDDSGQRAAEALAQRSPDALGERLGRTLAEVVAEERCNLPPGVPADEEAWSVEDYDGAWAYFGP
ncbi:MAG: hypothetical protein AAF907_11200, partial [Planctomycetota bacterium]